jgi:ATP-dependent Clp protease protease subunit
MKRYQRKRTRCEDQDSEDSGDEEEKKEPSTRITVCGNVIRVFSQIDDVIAMKFVVLLQQLSDKIRKEEIMASDINVHIMSPGGGVAAAMVMVDAIQSCPYSVSTRVVGMCASAATLVALSATGEVLMSYYASFLIHEPRGGVIGSAHDIAEENENMRVVRDILRRFYIYQCPKLAKDVLDDLLDSNKELNAETALEYGIVSRLV